MMMNRHIDLGRTLFLILLFFLSTLTALAGNITGTVTDKQTHEPLIGATVQVEGTTTGAITDADGRYTLSAPRGNIRLIIRYVGYKDLLSESIRSGNDPLTLDFELETDAQALGEVSVVARKNLESERALQMERQKAVLAIENMGAKEMSLKGISNVQEGVKKITGISIANAGQLIVRGLGDRYSITTLNGLPIASPNPDNKLIPLDLFPASTVQNITVSKVYEAGAFADYSGAHIDISTKENTGEDFFSVGFNVGGKFNTLGQDFYSMDRSKSLFSNPGIDPQAMNLTGSQFQDYIRTQNPFSTTFQVKKRTALPEFGSSTAMGKNWDINGQRLSLFASLGISNDVQNLEDAYVRTIEAGGSTLTRFNYDSYANELKIAGLGNLSYTLRKADHIGYTFFYARNAVDTYMRREGVDYEDNDLIGSNSVTHIYTLQNHQVNGHHEFGTAWELDWKGSYSKTSSNEPDRRQVMFRQYRDRLDFFKLNQQETMRYFGTLDEDEWVGDLRASYKFDDKNRIRFGATYKDKARDFKAIRFYYDLGNMPRTDITNIYDMNPYLNTENIANGNISITRDNQLKDTYHAGHDIYAGFIETEYYPISNLLINVGLRYEYSKQWVNYYTETGTPQRNTINKNDLFPALNMKYTLDQTNSLRFAFSRTVTRPSFVEMAPFLYQESYGAAQIRGNAELQNGYNYNFDLRYERFAQDNSTNMFAVTAYAKILADPIERTQYASGGATVHSFDNANTGVAAGVEIEFRRELFKDFRLGINGSYMYTNVKLSEEGGSYTNSQRALQGASPYLVNADITYSPRFKNDRQLTTSLLYNLQGPRIHAVGIRGLGDEKQEEVHTLDFVAGYELNDHFSLKLQVSDLLNRDIIFNQETNDGRKLEVERYKKGTSFEIGFTYKL